MTLALWLVAPAAGCFTYYLVEANADVVDPSPFVSGETLCPNFPSALGGRPRIVSIKVDYTGPGAEESLLFKLTDPSGTVITDKTKEDKDGKIENEAPYSVFGDSGKNIKNYQGKTLAPGTHTLETEAYSEDEAKGTLLCEETITFIVDDCREVFASC